MSVDVNLYIDVLKKDISRLTLENVELKVLVEHFKLKYQEKENEINNFKKEIENDNDRQSK